MSIPSDKVLYKKVKHKIYKKYPKHSAYRSGLLVKKYKEKFKEKHKGTRKKPYLGKYIKTKGLARWFAEKWTNQRGETGYKYKSDIYRPQEKITSKTPLTHEGLTDKERKRGRRIKGKGQRVGRFRKRSRSRSPSKRKKKRTSYKRKGTTGREVPETFTLAFSH